VGKGAGGAGRCLSAAGGGCVPVALNNRAAVRVQIADAAKNNYPAWGVSPCVDPSNLDNFLRCGIARLGIDPAPDAVNNGIITPHASFLALGVPEFENDVHANISALLNYPGLYGPCGFYDAIQVAGPNAGQVATKYQCIDQAMTLIAIDNVMHNNAIRNRFHKEPDIKAQESLLGIEEFF